MPPGSTLQKVTALLGVQPAGDPAGRSARLLAVPATSMVALSPCESFTVTAACRKPATFGEKPTLMLQLALGARVAPHVVGFAWKSAALKLPD